MRAATLRLQRKYTSAINKGFPLWLKVWAVSLPFVRSETYSQLVHQIYSITKIYVSNTLILLSLVGSPTREPASATYPLYIHVYIHGTRSRAGGRPWCLGSGRFVQTQYSDCYSPRRISLARHHSAHRRVSETHPPVEERLSRNLRENQLAEPEPIDAFATALLQVYLVRFGASHQLAEHERFAIVYR
jgi:hypothetical protein